MQGAVRATIQQCRTFYKYAWFSTSVRSLFLCPPGGKYPNQAGWLAHQGLQFLESGAEEYCIPHRDEWKSIVLELGQCEDTWRYMTLCQAQPMVSYVSIFASKTPIANQDASVQLAKLAQKSDLVSRGIPRVSCIYYRVQHDSTISLGVCVCVQVFAFMLSCSFSPQNGSLGLCEFRTPPAWVSPIFEAFGRSNKWEGCERTLPKHLT